MTPLRHTQPHPVRRWMFFVSLLLIVYGTQVVIAQDADTTDEPVILPTATLAEITLVPTEMPSATDEPTPLPATLVSPALTIEATMEPTLITPSEPTVAATLPATILPATAIPSETALPPTLLPEETAVSEPTPFPVEPTPPTQSPQTSARITILPDTVRLPEKAVVSLAFAAQDLANVYRVAIACHADPAILLGTQASPGALFSGDQVLVADSGFQADGQWMRVVTQAGSEPAFPESGVVWSLNYQVIAPGLAQIVCLAQVSDRNGEALPLVAMQMALTIEGYQVAAEPAPTVEADDLTLSLSPTTQFETPATSATVEAPPAISPTAPASPTMQITPESTATAVETATLTGPVEIDAAPPTAEPVALLSHFSGSIVVSEPSLQAVVTITGAGGQQTVAVQPDGSFAIDIPPGSYEIIFSAPQYLSYVLEGIIPEASVALSPITLVNGDVDGNEVIEGADVALVIQHFGAAVSPAASAADLNGDQVVDIFDLAIVSANVDRNNNSGIIHSCRALEGCLIPPP